MSLAEWREVLGEDPLEVTHSLCEKGLLVRASLADHLGYRFNVDELKGLLEARGLSTSGRKDELILRLVNADYTGMWKVVSGLELLQCSAEGIKLIEQYFQQTKSEDIRRGLPIPTDRMREVIKWVLAAVATGVVGNLAYDALKKLWEDIQKPPPNTPPTPSLPKWIEFAGNVFDGVEVRMHINGAIIFDEPSIVTLLKSYGVPVYITVDIDLKNINNSTERFRTEAAICQAIVWICLQSEVCKGLTFPRDTLFDKQSNRKPAYYAIMSAINAYLSHQTLKSLPSNVPLLIAEQNVTTGEWSWSEATPEKLADKAGIRIWLR